MKAYCMQSGVWRISVIFICLVLLLNFTACVAPSILYSESEIREFQQRYSIVKVLGVETKSGEMIPFHENSAGTITNTGILGRPKVHIKFQTEDSLVVNPYSHEFLMVIKDNKRYSVLDTDGQGYVCSYFENILIPFSEIDNITAKPYNLAGTGMSNMTLSFLIIGYYLAGGSIFMLLIYEIIFDLW
jgi:hypothetical protein